MLVEQVIELVQGNALTQRNQVPSPALQKGSSALPYCVLGFGSSLTVTP